MGSKETIEKLVHALYVATERAVTKGDKLVDLGYNDMNRGQFLSLVRHAIAEAERWIEIPDYHDFSKFK